LMAFMHPEPPLVCAFCFANEDERADLVRHGYIAICDACIDACHAIVAKARARRAADAGVEA
jgi:ATP-dependent protease Clp ATPase subunit